MKKKEFYRFLLERYANGTASEGEIKELFEELENRKDDTDWEEMIGLLMLDTKRDEHYKETAWLPVIESILATKHQSAPIRRLYPRRWWVAAAVLLVMGTALTTYLLDSSDKINTSQGERQDRKDQEPGRQGAILTLTDNSQVLLDTMKEGAVVAFQGGAKATVVHGNLVYDSKGTEVVYNTIATPQGRQYRITLSDGTNVWLNALSSITYPASFKGTAREVSIKGEVYFEVARNKDLPFQIKINDQTAVKVLGTHFNVNAYQDEHTINTTLLEGSVRVISGQDSVVLKPGQQSQTRQTGGIGMTVSLQDADAVIAWKNGLFNFNNAGLAEVTRQLQRWYGIDVKFEGKVPEKIFRGELDRGVRLDAVLNWLTELGIQNRLEGHTLIITNH